MASNEIVDDWYSNIRPKSNRPFNDRQIVIGLINSLRTKLDHNRDKYAILKSKRAGPHPIRIRLIKRWE